MFERYSEKARRTVFFARYEASQLGRSYIESEHLLLGILREDKSLIPLLRIPSVEALRRKIEERLGPAKDKVSTSVDLPLSDECKRALTYAAEDADMLGSKNIETWHLMLGLLRVEKSAAVALLGEDGIDHATFLDVVKKMPTTPPERRRFWERKPVAEPDPEPEPEVPKAAAASLQMPLTRLQILITGARPHLEAFSNADGAVRLKRKDWSRRQAMGHLVDWASTLRIWIARAMTEPKVTVASYPMDEWVGAQGYEAVRLKRLVALWLGLNDLLLQVIAQVPEEKLETPFRVGIDEPTTLLRVIQRYVEHCEDLVAQVLVRS